MDQVRISTLIEPKQHERLKLIAGRRKTSVQSLVAFAVGMFLKLPDDAEMKLPPDRRRATA